MPRYNRLNARLDIKTAYMVGFQQDGSPLLEVLNRYGSEAGQAMADRLLQGLALGQGPGTVARLIRRDMGMALWEALRLARTETLRAYRAASMETYRANEDIVEGWYWLIARNTRTCAMCWAMDGTFHKLGDSLDDHPNGRCTAVPKLRGIDLPARLPGVEAFDKLRDVDQFRILGPSKYAAYRAGELKLPQLIGVKHSQEWGRMFYERSLKGVLGTGEARKYYPSGPLKVMGYSFFRPEAFGKISIVRQVYQVGYSKRGWAYHEELFRKQYLPRFKVRDDIEWTVGLWGTPEPSFNARLKGSYLNVIRMSKQWGKDFNQDGMALLIPSKGAKGGVLSWDFGRHLSLDEMDRLLGGLMKVNEGLKPGDAFEFIGLTVKDRSRVEFWIDNESKALVGRRLIDRAINLAGLDTKKWDWQGGYEFLLLGKEDY